MVVVGPDRRDRFALGARQWIGGDEPVWPIDGAGQVGAPQVGHGSGVNPDPVQWDPGRADAVAGQVEIPEILMECRFFGGSRLLHQDRVLVEVDVAGRHQYPSYLREGGGGGERGERLMVSPVVDS